MAQLCVWCVMLICAERQDAANGPGKWFCADCCEGAERFGFVPPHSSSGVVFQRLVRPSAAVGHPVFPQGGDVTSCGVTAAVLSSHWHPGVSSVTWTLLELEKVHVNIHSHTHTHIHVGYSPRHDVWNLVLRC